MNKVFGGSGRSTLQSEKVKISSASDAIKLNYANSGIRFFFLNLTHKGT